MLAIRRAETVFIVVWLVVHLARIKTAIVSLLQLDGVDPAFLSRTKQFLSRFQLTLVIVRSKK